MTTSAIITGNNVSDHNNEAVMAANAWAAQTGSHPYKVAISDTNGELSFAIVDEDFDTIGGVTEEMEVMCF